MRYSTSSNLRSESGFFRSTAIVAVAGIGTGFSVIAAATDPQSLDLKAALATVVSAGVVALADWIVRRRSIRRHEDNVFTEHEKTRALIRGERKRKRKPSLSFK